MSIVSIERVGEHLSQEVTIRGWLYNLREAGKLLFPIFRDGTGLLQGVVSQKEQPEAFAALRGLTQESSVVVTGTIRSEPRAPGGFEMGVTRVIYTDTVRDGTLTEPNFAALEVIVSYIRISATKLKIIYAGGVSSIDHLRRLAGTGVEGAIVGRALYTGDIDLSEALATIEGAAGWQ